jgi:glycosyltransferase involved in cell wall biosynthesis
VRILFVSPFPPLRDGIGDYAAGLARELGARGHEVAVVVPAPLDGAPDAVLGALPRSPRGLGGLEHAIAAFGPDVVHVQFAVAAYGTRIPALLALLARVRRDGIRVVVTMHEVVRDTGSLRAAGRALYGRLHTAADAVLLHTERARRTLGDGAGPATVIPHPRASLPAAGTTPAELRERHRLGDRPVLLAFGFVHVDKGLDDLVDALARMERDDATLVVAGAVRPRPLPFKPFEWRDRRHLRAVRRAIDRNGLRERVRFTGYVPAGDVAPWFATAEAAVLPYRRIDQSGVANLADAAGTPVLASRIGGLGEGAADGRYAYPPRAPQRLAAALDAFLGDPGAGDRARADQAPAPDLPDFAAATERLYVREGNRRAVHA